jgi:N-carbamoyl-L-amino-acid hydrolase
VPPVVTGSHLDTQPVGGGFDGIYGVLAGLEAVQAIGSAGVETERPIDVVVWTNEEGTRFVPGHTGSAGFANPDRLSTLLAVHDRDGVSVGSSLRYVFDCLPDAKQLSLGFPVASYIEAHIEQGPILEAAETTIGVVTGIQGARRFWVEVHGEEAHAGTTPRSQRRDALSAAVSIIAQLEKLLNDVKEVGRFTVGTFDVHPNASATVPSYVRFSIDFRHPDASVLTTLGDEIERLCRRHAGPCDVTVRQRRTVHRSYLTRGFRVWSARPQIAWV